MGKLLVDAGLDLLADLGVNLGRHAGPDGDAPTTPALAVSVYAGSAMATRSRLSGSYQLHQISNGAMPLLWCRHNGDHQFAEDLLELAAHRPKIHQHLGSRFGEAVSGA